jgi:hypothetical protein
LNGQDVTSQCLLFWQVGADIGTANGANYSIVNQPLDGVYLIFVYAVLVRTDGSTVSGVSQPVVFAFDPLIETGLTFFTGLVNYGALTVTSSPADLVLRLTVGQSSAIQNTYSWQGLTQEGVELSYLLVNDNIASFLGHPDPQTDIDGVANIDVLSHAPGVTYFWVVATKVTANPPITTILNSVGFWVIDVAAPTVLSNRPEVPPNEQARIAFELHDCNGDLMSVWRDFEILWALGPCNAQKASGGRMIDADPGHPHTIGAIDVRAPNTWGEPEAPTEIRIRIHSMGGETWDFSLWADTYFP